MKKIAAITSIVAIIAGGAIASQTLPETGVTEEWKDGPAIIYTNEATILKLREIRRELGHLDGEIRQLESLYPRVLVANEMYLMDETTSGTLRVQWGRAGDLVGSIADRIERVVPMAQEASVNAAALVPALRALEAQAPSTDIEE